MSYRILLPKHTVFITSRTWRELPFVCTNLMNSIIWGILGRSQHLYPVKINCFKFMGNHFHMIATVEDPQVLVGFIDRLKTETAHAVNKLLGRRKVPVWEEGYDALTLLTEEDVIEKIAYIYNNATKANLVPTIDEYPGVSSWQMFLDDTKSVSVPWINRQNIAKLEKTSLSESEDRILTKSLTSQSSSHTFTLSPFAWIDYFQIPISEIAEIKKRIINRVREKEIDINKNSPKFLGVQALKRRNMDHPFIPKKYAPKMWCISKDKEKKITFIKFVKELAVKARHVYTLWKKQDFSIPFPLGLFPPSFPKVANLVPIRI